MTILTIQDPSDIDDQRLVESAPSTPAALDSLLAVESGTSNAIRSILKFDFSALPASVINLTSATLSVYFHTVGAGTPEGRTYKAKRLTQLGWVEAQASWDDYSTGNAWAVAGGDFTATDEASATVPAVGNWIDFDVADLVRYAIDNDSEIAHYIIMDNDEAGADQAQFYSSREATQTTLRPKLVIEYTEHVLPSVLPISISLLAPADVTDNTMLPGALGISASLLTPTYPIDVTIIPSVLSISVNLPVPSIDLLLTIFPSVLPITVTLESPTIVIANPYTLEATLPAHTLIATISTAITLEQTLPALTLEASCKSGQILTMTGVLPVLTLESHMGIHMEATLPALTLESTLTTGGVMSLDRKLPALTLVASMTSGRLMTLNANLAALTLSANLVNGNILTLAQTLPALTLESAGTTGNNMSLTQTLPALTLISTARSDEAYTLTATLPALELEAFMDNYLARYI